MQRDEQGGTQSDTFNQFVNTVTRGFLVARDKCAGPVLALAGGLADSALPCFRYKPDNLAKLVQKFALGLSSYEAAKTIRLLISQSCQAFTTDAYDVVQKLQNNIH